MIDLIRQLALDVAEKGADFCKGTVLEAEPLRILLEEGLELTEEFLILTEAVLEREETGTISINGGEWSSYRMKRSRTLQQGEVVILLRSSDGQQYLVLDRAGKEE